MKIQSTIQTVINVMTQELGFVRIEFTSATDDLISKNLSVSITHYFVIETEIPLGNNEFFTVEDIQLFKTEFLNLQGSERIAFLEALELANGSVEVFESFLLNHITTDLLIDGIHTKYKLLPENWNALSDILEAKNNSNSDKSNSISKSK